MKTMETEYKNDNKQLEDTITKIKNKCNELTNLVSKKDEEILKINEKFKDLSDKQALVNQTTQEESSKNEENAKQEEEQKEDEITKELEEKTKELEERMKEIDTLKSHLTIWTEQAKQYKDKDKQSRTELRSLKINLKKLEKEKSTLLINAEKQKQNEDTLEKTVSDLKNELKEKLVELDHVKHTNAKLKKKSEEMTKFVKSRTDKLLKTENQMEELKPIIEKGHQYDELHQAYEALELQHVKLSEKQASLKSTLDFNRESLVSSLDEVKKLKNNLKDANSEIEASKKAIIKQEKDMNRSFNKKMSELSKTYERKLSDQTKSYEKQLKDQSKLFEKQIDEQKKTFEKLYEDTSKQHRDFTNSLQESLQNKINQAKNENQDIIRGYRSTIEKINADQDLKSENVQKQFHQLQLRHKQALDDQAGQFKVQIASLHSKIAGKDNTIANLQEQLSNKDTEIEEERQRRQLVIFSYKENQAKMKEREALLKNEIEKYLAIFRRYDRSATEFIHVVVQSSIARAETAYYREQHDIISDRRQQDKIQLDSNEVTIDRLQNETRILEKRLKDTKMVAKSKLTKQSTMIRDLQRQLKRVRKNHSSAISVSSHASSSSSATQAKPTPFVASPSLSTASRMSMSSDVHLLEKVQQLERQNDRLLYEKGLADARVHQTRDSLQASQKRVLDLEEDVEAKRVIIQNYIKRERAGRLLDPEQEANRAQIARQKSNATGWSLFGRKSTTSTPSKTDLSALQNQTQRVLEEMILENLQLKKQLQLMGDEVDRLLQKNKS